MTSGNKERRMHRKTADRLLGEVIERAKDVNLNDMYCYRINRLIVFGSYVNTDREDLGDLDIALDMSPRYDKDDSHWEDARERYPVNDWLMRQYYPLEEVLRYIRDRNPYISVHRLGRDKEQDELIFSDKTIIIDLEGSE